MAGRGPSSVLLEGEWYEMFTRAGFAMQDPAERHGCILLVESEMKDYPILGHALLLIQQSTFMGSITALPECAVILNAFIFVDRKVFFRW